MSRPFLNHTVPTRKPSLPARITVTVIQGVAIAYVLNKHKSTSNKCPVMREWDWFKKPS